MKVEQSKTTVNSHRIQNTPTRCRTMDMIGQKENEDRSEKSRHNTRKKCKN
jgi:hypothetical protein